MGGISAASDIDQGPFEPIAIIGMGCIMPDAPDVDAFWKNVQDARVSFREVPVNRWDAADFHSEVKQENMTYHYVHIMYAGKIYQFCSIFNIQGQWLFNQDVLPRLNDISRNIIMGFCRCGYSKAVKFFILECIIYILIHTYFWILIRKTF